MKDEHAGARSRPDANLTDPSVDQTDSDEKATEQIINPNGPQLSDPDVPLDPPETTAEHDKSPENAPDLRPLD
jgi:hypothetical protein